MSMMGSLALFEILQPRFREIIWHADGLQNENLLLAPGYPGQKEPIPHVGHASEGQLYSTWLPRYGRERSDWRPSFNIREGNLAFGFTFDPTGDLSLDPETKGLTDQLEEAALRALRHGPFKERCFFMNPKFEIPLTLFLQKVEFSHTGDPIPGLWLGEVMVHDWTFFIPEGPERDAIRMAIDLERAQAEQEEYHRRDPKRELVQGLQKRLGESLSAIAM